MLKDASEDAVAQKAGLSAVALAEAGEDLFQKARRLEFMVPCLSVFEYRMHAVPAVADAWAKVVHGILEGINKPG